jgi:hypothetical protein
MRLRFRPMFQNMPLKKDVKRPFLHIIYKNVFKIIYLYYITAVAFNICSVEQM